MGKIMTTPTTVRRRLEHVQAIIDTATEHIDSPGDEYALTRAQGLLEQTFADLDDFEFEQNTDSSSPE